MHLLPPNNSLHTLNFWTEWQHLSILVTTKSSLQRQTLLEQTTLFVQIKSPPSLPTCNWLRTRNVRKHCVYISSPNKRFQSTVAPLRFALILGRIVLANKNSSSSDRKHYKGGKYSSNIAFTDLFYFAFWSIVCIQSFQCNLVYDFFIIILLSLYTLHLSIHISFYFLLSLSLFLIFISLYLPTSIMSFVYSILSPTLVRSHENVRTESIIDAGRSISWVSPSRIPAAMPRKSSEKQTFFLGFQPSHAPPISPVISISTLSTSLSLSLFLILSFSLRRVASSMSLAKVSNGRLRFQPGDRWQLRVMKPSVGRHQDRDKHNVSYTV